uniref:Zinc finger protein, FOG family member 2 n=1 Tax=Hucho hucho TaxID=62062 RepID=A0A4W5PHV1_9TELE
HGIQKGSNCNQKRFFKGFSYGDRELEILYDGTERRTRFRQALPVGTTWGPFEGKIEMTTAGSDMPVPVVLTGSPRWLQDVTWLAAEDGKSNCVVYSIGGQLWCTTTKPIMEGEELAAFAVDFYSRLQAVNQAALSEGMYPDRLLDSIQLLPQQANMASILPNAIVNSKYNAAVSTGGSTMKCIVCDHTADSFPSLQKHILSHLSQTGYRCSHCHFSFTSARELDKHHEIHGHSHNPLRQHCPSQAETESSPRVERSPQRAKMEQGKEFLQSPVLGSCLDTRTSPNAELVKIETSPVKADLNSGSRASFSYTSVKSEPSSHRQASLPIQNNMIPAAFPMGPFLSHFPFSQDIRAAPQASEILAKMSELVHHRLRHGGTNHYPVHVMYSTLVPKGATCFECNITFGNLDNYLIHKKHYCNSGWQLVAKPHDYTGVLDKVTDTGSPKSGGLGGLGSLNMSQGDLSDTNSHLTSPCLNLSGLDLFNVGEGKAQVQAELPGTVENPSTPTRTDKNPSIQADVTSPKTSQTPKTEILDPNKTTCEPCKITFSRTETYMVHKQYYCATRHDPLMKRAQSTKLTATQRTVRTRKRRKNFEMNIPNHEQRDHHPHYFGIAPIGGPGMCQNPREVFGNQFHPRYNMFLGMVPKHPKANLPFTKSAMICKCNAIAQDELDNPIDLSKKCSSSPGKLSTTHKRLMDYHWCTVCKISFNKVEEYLAHKQSSCPVTAPDRKTSAVVKRGGFNNPVEYNDTNLEKCVTNGANKVFLQIGSTNGDQLAVIKEESTEKFLSQEFSPPLFKKMRRDEQISTFYRIKPANYTTGTVVMQKELREQRQSPNEASEVEKDQPMPDGYQESQGVLPQNGPKEPEDTENTLQDNKRVNYHLPDSHVSSLSDSESPVSVNSKKSTSSSFSSPALSKTEEVLPSCVKRGLNGSIQATKCNVKYCRPCDIQFNNLSNFITHKKFYCSSHTAEHVK